MLKQQDSWVRYENSFILLHSPPQHHLLTPILGFICVFQYPPHRLTVARLDSRKATFWVSDSGRTFPVSFSWPLQATLSHGT